MDDRLDRIEEFKQWIEHHVRAEVELEFYRREHSTVESGNGDKFTPDDVAFLRELKISTGGAL
jgi:hypothetical protein